MLDRALFDFLNLGFSAHILRGGFGHFGGHHRGAGIIFGARLLELGLAATVALIVAAMATLSVSDWVRQHYGDPDYAQAAGVVTFIVVVVVLGSGIARFL